MVGLHCRRDGLEFEQAPGDGKGKAGVLQFMGLQRVGYNLATVQFATPLLFLINLKKFVFSLLDCLRI